MDFITIDGINTAYTRAGHQGRDILFLHGWAASARMWLRSMWALRRHFRLWAFDLPGFGESAAPDLEWYSMAHYREHIAACCEALEIEPYAIVGHSMGGRLAFDLAYHYPQMAERLVAISPALTGRLSFNLDLLLIGGVGRTLVELAQHVRPVAAVNVMAQYWAPKYLGSEGVKRTVDDLRRASWSGSIGSLRAVVGQDYLPCLADIHHPTLLITGARDYTVPPDDSRQAADILPDARLVILEKVHHQPTDEAPQIYLQELQAFLCAEEVPVAG